MGKSKKNRQGVGDELPLGFSMALAQNPAAYERFFSLPPEQRQQILAGVKGIQSKEEMRAYVSRIGQGGFQSFQ